MRTWRLLPIACLVLLCGCGSTIRFEVAPTFDTELKLGFEATLSAGIGLPIGFVGRSYHYIQGLGSVGGGRDGEGSSLFMLAGSAEYLYWSEPQFDFRAGGRFAYRSLTDDKDKTALYGIGAHVAFLPAITEWDTGWLIPQVCLGPALRGEYVWSDPTGLKKGVFSLPLVMEFNFLAAGE